MLLSSTARYTALTMLFPLAAISPVKGSKIFLEIFESPFACLLIAGGLGAGGPPFRNDIQMKSGRDTQRTTCTPNAGKTRRASALTLFWKQSLQVDYYLASAVWALRFYTLSIIESLTRNSLRIGNLSTMLARPSCWPRIRVWHIYTYESECEMHSWILLIHLDLYIF